MSENIYNKFTYIGNKLKHNIYDINKGPSQVKETVHQDLRKYASIALMGQIVSSTDEKPIIGTTALDTCYGILFYDRANKWGLVGHAAPSSKIVTLSEMITKLGKKPRIIECAIVSGYRNVERSDTRGEEELREYLHNYCPPNILFVPYQGSLNTKVCSNVYAYEFALNVKTGKSVTHDLFGNEELGMTNGHLL